MIYTDKEFDEIIERLNKMYHDLNEWEQGFLDNVRAIRLANRQPTDGQKKKISEIWLKVAL